MEQEMAEAKKNDPYPPKVTGPDKCEKTGLMWWHMGTTVMGQMLPEQFASKALVKLIDAWPALVSKSKLHVSARLWLSNGTDLPPIPGTDANPCTSFNTTFQEVVKSNGPLMGSCISAGLHCRDPSCCPKKNPQFYPIYGAVVIIGCDYENKAELKAAESLAEQVLIQEAVRAEDRDLIVPIQWYQPMVRCLCENVQAPSHTQKRLPTDFQIDTGAELSAVSQQLVDSLGLVPTAVTDIRSVSGHKVPAKVYVLNVGFGHFGWDSTVFIQAVLLPGSTNILGQNFLQQFNIACVFPASEDRKALPTVELSATGDLTRVTMACLNGTTSASDTFILDTGASYCAMSPVLWDKLGIKAVCADTVKDVAKAFVAAVGHCQFQLSNGQPQKGEVVLLPGSEDNCLGRYVLAMYGAVLEIRGLRQK
jgi:predicted aspartyl protease